MPQAVEALVQGFDFDAAEEKGQVAAADVQLAADMIRADILRDGGTLAHSELAVDAAAQEAFTYITLTLAAYPVPM